MMNRGRLFLMFAFVINGLIINAAAEMSSDIVPTTYSQDLGRIVVSSKRVDSPADQSADNLSVYTAEELKNIPAHNLSEALKYLPGVDVKVNSELGQASSLSMNGAPARQVLLLVDGIPFNTQLSGQANPARIPIESIKQVEIIKGGLSSAWGSGLGGVINVITKDVGKTIIPKVEITSAFAEFATFKDSINMSGKLGRVGYFWSGSWLSTDGTKSYNDTDEKKGFGKISTPLTDDSRLTAAFGYSGSDTHFGPTRTNRIQANPYQTRYGSLTYEIEKAKIHSNVTYKYNDQDIISNVFNATTHARVSSSINHNLYQGMSVINSADIFSESDFVFGTDLAWQKFKSNNYLTEGKSISSQAPFMNYTYTWNHWNVIPGLRYDHNQHFGSQTSPSLGLVYHFEDVHHSLVRSKVSRAFNAPPLLWIFNNDPSLLVGPNPQLKPERAVVYELGIETKPTLATSLELNLFRADVNDGIATVFDNGLFRQENFDKFRRQGAELLLSYQVLKSLSVYASGAFTDVKNLGTKQTVRDLGIARQRFHFGTNYRSLRGWGVDLMGYYNRFSSPSASQPNDRKPIFDLKLSKDINAVDKILELQLFLNIHNLTNSKYWADIELPLPRRYFEGGFSAKF